MYLWSAEAGSGMDRDRAVIYIGVATGRGGLAGRMQGEMRGIRKSACPRAIAPLASAILFRPSEDHARTRRSAALRRRPGPRSSRRRRRRRPRCCWLAVFDEQGERGFGPGGVAAVHRVRPAHPERPRTRRAASCATPATSNVTDVVTDEIEIWRNRRREGLDPDRYDLLRLGEWPPTPAAPTAALPPPTRLARPPRRARGEHRGLVRPADRRARGRDRGEATDLITGRRAQSRPSPSKTRGPS